MPIRPGERLGPYEIVSPIAAGGMGEVYRARDTRLDRTVAVKILQTSLNADAELRGRFEREAQVISALDHPHICPLYDVGEHNGTHFLVMPCLEGETLADRLRAGPLPSKQALQIALQIADGLDAAHRAAVVHRDLKPGNIMLTPSGAKLLDFGLAKLTPSVSQDIQDRTRLTGAATISGTVLGTTPYMAPEQIEGRATDARSDIFAFGIVLHEMLTGHRPFSGDTPAQVMSAILRDEPTRVTASQPGVPAALDYVIGTCLAKDPDERWQNARDVALALKGIGTAKSSGDEAEASRYEAKASYHRRRERFAWVAVGLLTIALAAVTMWSAARRPPIVVEGNRVRFAIASPGKPGDDAVSVSPDGRQVAFAAAGPDGKAILWIRALDETALRPVPGTEEITQHFWSPDTAWVAFFAQGKLKRVNLTTGVVETLCNATNPRGGSWGADNTIILSPSTGQGLYVVPASGGEPRQLTALDPRRAERSHRWPLFLPDGRHFLYVNRSGNPEHAGVYVGSTTSSTTNRVAPGTSNAAYVEPGYLLVVRGATLYAQPFDLRTLTAQGEAVAVREPVHYDTGMGRADFGVSTTGVLAYRSGEGLESRLTWLDRQGNRLKVVGPTRRHTNLALSPDDKRIVAARFGQTSASDLWLIDASTGSESRLTFEGAGESQPLWSPDGQWIAFGSDRSGYLDLYRIRAAGGQPELLLSSPIVKYASSWSVDNRQLVFEVDDPRTKLDIWTLPLSGDRKPLPLLNTSADEWDGRLSPDGKWMAYTSNESGRYEVYVQSFPSAGSKWQVSLNGGLHPRWRADGKELFYVAANQKLTAVTREPGAEFSIGARQELFELTIPNIFTVRSPYAVSGDGQRFVLEDARTDLIPPVHVVLNWAGGLPR